MLEIIAKKFRKKTIFIIIRLSIIFVALITLLIYLFRHFYSTNILILRTIAKLAIKTIITIFLIKSFKIVANLICNTSYIILLSILCEVCKEFRSLDK